MKATLADAFLERFQLTPAEIKALRVSKENVVSEVNINFSFLEYQFSNIFHDC